MLLTLIPATAFADGDEDLSEIYHESVSGGGVTTAGVGLSGRYDGVRNMSGVIDVTGVPVGASVEQAWLYWSTWLTPDNDPTFQGQALSGQLIGTSADTGWRPMIASSYAFRTDVTSLVTGNGGYVIEGLQSSPLNGDVNGAGIVVVYSDPAATQSATIVVSDGAKTWCGAGSFTEDFGGLALPEQPTSARFGLEVADGQDASGVTQLPDSGLEFGALSFTATFNAADGGMWDRDVFDVLSEFDATTSNASWTYLNDGLDCVQFVSTWLDIRWPDADGDLISDASDNCLNVANPAQADRDNDGVGDACSTPVGVDMGVDVGMDAGSPDLGAVDLGLPDLGAMDLGHPDVGSGFDLGSGLDLGILDPPGRDMGGSRRDMHQGTPQDSGGTDGGPTLEAKAASGCCATTSSDRSTPFLLVLALIVGLRRR